MTIPVISTCRPRDVFSLMGIPLFYQNTAPEEIQIEYEKPVCTRTERCKDCPYPAHGFVCWRENGECMRTDMEKITEREKRKNGSNHQ